MNISPHWTPTERLRLIHQVAFKLSGMTYPDRILAMSIQALCTESAAYLENNRERLLAEARLDNEEEKRMAEESMKKKDTAELEKKVSKWNWRKSDKPIFGRKKEE